MAGRTSYRDLADLAAHIRVASGKEPADLVIRNAH